jgi:hypothetical protein
MPAIVTDENFRRLYAVMFGSSVLLEKIPQESYPPVKVSDFVNSQIPPSGDGVILKHSQCKKICLLVQHIT